KKNIKYELSPGSDETVRIDFNPSDKRREGVYADPIEMPPYYLIGLTVTASLAGAVGFSLYYLRKGQDESEGLAVGG
ncbi:MAG: hypothetical protein KGY76_09170, partial [Candidatus Thermoplasmatota archaeon]|nr:hypothetical protein [Candidatus Thermoplasmatota archaeon]